MAKAREQFKDILSTPSDDEDEVYSTVSVLVKSTSTDVVERYYEAVSLLIVAIQREKFVYHLTPTLVAARVSTNVLRLLPTTVKGFHVRSQIIAGDLFILELSSQPEHGTGVANLLEQVGVWRAQHSADDFLASTTNSDYPNADCNAAPDLVLRVGGNYAAQRGANKIGKNSCQVRS